jgi:LysM repeat protein
LDPSDKTTIFPMKILKILGIAAGIHALALLLIFANPGCSYTKAAATEPSPISAAPGGDAGPAPSSAVITPPDTVGIRYSPTRPGTTVAGALESQPVADVTPATTYTVARGDSLWSIAKKNQITKADLAAANNLKTSAVLHLGQKLIIPSKAGHAAPEAEAAPGALHPAGAGREDRCRGDQAHRQARRDAWRDRPEVRRETGRHRGGEQHHRPEEDPAGTGARDPG